MRNLYTWIGKNIGNNSRIFVHPDSEADYVFYVRKHWPESFQFAHHEVHPWTMTSQRSILSTVSGYKEDWHKVLAISHSQAHFENVCFCPWTGLNMDDSALHIAVEQKCFQLPAFNSSIYFEFASVYVFDRIYEDGIPLSGTRGYQSWLNFL